MHEQDNDTNSLAHTKWNCKYHVVFAPKYRRKVFYNEKRADVREILRTLCQWKGVDIIEGEICPDHVHLLLSIPPKMSISYFMGYLKGKRALLIFQKYGNMKFAYRNREFWCKNWFITEWKSKKECKIDKKDGFWHNLCNISFGSFRQFLENSVIGGICMMFIGLLALPVTPWQNVFMVKK